MKKIILTTGFDNEKVIGEINIDEKYLNEKFLDSHLLSYGIIVNKKIGNKITDCEIVEFSFIKNNKHPITKK